MATPDTATDSYEDSDRTDDTSDLEPDPKRKRIGERCRWLAWKVDLEDAWGDFITRTDVPLPIAMKVKDLLQAPIPICSSDRSECDLNNFRMRRIARGSDYDPALFTDED